MERKNKTYWQFINNTGNWSMIIAFSAIIFGVIKSMKTYFDPLDPIIGYIMIICLIAIPTSWLIHRYKVWKKLYK